MIFYISTSSNEMTLSRAEVILRMTLNRNEVISMMKELINHPISIDDYFGRPYMIDDIDQFIQKGDYAHGIALLKKRKAYLLTYPI